MITCDQFTERLSDLLEHDNADWAGAREARAHAEGCAHCRALWQSSGVMLRLLRNDAALPLPEDARLRLRAALERGLGAQPVAAGPPRPWWRALFAGTRPMALAAAMVLVLMGAGVMRWRAGLITTSGWLIDRHCLAAFASHPADHTLQCMLRCQDQQYGVLDATGTFIAFDAAGDRTALVALQASQQTDHLWVTIKGRTGRDQLLHVDHLELTPAAEAGETARQPTTPAHSPTPLRPTIAQLETDARIRR